MRKLLFLIPLAAFLVLAGYFFVGLGHDPSEVPSVLLDRPVPAFDMPPIKGEGRGFGTTDLTDQVTLVNVFGSWCVACRVEHPFLMQLQAKKLVPIYGIDWRETDDEAGPEWLRRFGNPYDRIGNDPVSKVAIAFGVTGAPESFIVDAKGIIRHKHTGPITPEVWEQELWPIIEHLRRG